jgi:hypothetical protein
MMLGQAGQVVAAPEAGWHTGIVDPQVPIVDYESVIQAISFPLDPSAIRPPLFVLTF